MTFKEKWEDPFAKHGLTESEADLSVELSIDPEKAWSKMAKFGLANPSDWILCFLEALLLHGARNISASLVLPAIKSNKDIFFDSIGRFLEIGYLGAQRSSALQDSDAAIFIEFASPDFDFKEIASLPAYLLEDNDKYRVLHLLAVSIAGAFGNGISFIDLMLQGKRNSMNFKIERGIAYDIKVASKEVSHASLSYCKVFYEAGYFLACETLKHLEEKARRIVKKPFLPVHYTLRVTPHSPLPLSYAYDLQDHYTLNGFTQYVGYEYAAIESDNAQIPYYIAVTHQECSSMVIFERNAIRLDKKKFGFPWKIPTRVIVDHPDLKTDLSRNLIDHDCPAYKEIIRLLPDWQEKALIKIIEECQNAGSAACRRVHYNILYSLIKEHLPQIKKHLQVIKSIENSKNNDNKNNNDAKTFVEVLVLAPIFNVIIIQKNNGSFSFQSSKRSLLLLFSYVQDGGKLYVTSQPPFILRYNHPSNSCMMIIENSKKVRILLSQVLRTMFNEACAVF